VPGQLPLGNVLAPVTMRCGPVAASPRLPCPPDGWRPARMARRGMPIAAAWPYAQAIAGRRTIVRNCHLLADLPCPAAQGS